MMPTCTQWNISGAEVDLYYVAWTRASWSKINSCCRLTLLLPTMPMPALGDVGSLRATSWSARRPEGPFRPSIVSKRVSDNSPGPWGLSPKATGKNGKKEECAGDKSPKHISSSIAQVKKLNQLWWQSSNNWLRRVWYSYLQIVDITIWNINLFVSVCEIERLQRVIYLVSYL